MRREGIRKRACTVGHTSSNKAIPPNSSLGSEGRKSEFRVSARLSPSEDCEERLLQASPSLWLLAI